MDYPRGRADSSRGRFEHHGRRHFISQAGQFVVIKRKTDDPGEIGTMDQAKIHALFGKALTIQPLSPARFLLFFKPESIHPNPESEAEIPKIMQAIEDRNSMDISLNGHTDRMGEDDYNYSLSFQRAKQIRSMLEKQGIDSSYITITSHGPTTPLVPTADDVPEPLTVASRSSCDKRPCAPFPSSNTRPHEQNRAKASLPLVCSWA